MYFLKQLFINNDGILQYYKICLPEFGVFHKILFLSELLSVVWTGQGSLGKGWCRMLPNIWKKMWWQLGLVMLPGYVKSNLNTCYWINVLLIYSFRYLSIKVYTVILCMVKSNLWLASWRASSKLTHGVDHSVKAPSARWQDVNISGWGTPSPTQMH